MCWYEQAPGKEHFLLFHMRYRFSFEADLGCPETKEEGAFHSGRTVICLVPRMRGVFVGARVGAILATVVYLIAMATRSEGSPWPPM